MLDTAHSTSSPYNPSFEVPHFHVPAAFFQDTDPAWGPERQTKDVGGEVVTKEVSEVLEPTTRSNELDAQ